ncbi:MAG: DUF6456 domain-containing protein [Pseudomonadota bacterium]
MEQPHGNTEHVDAHETRLDGGASNVGRDVIRRVFRCLAHPGAMIVASEQGSHDVQPYRLVRNFEGQLQELNFECADALSSELVDGWHSQGWMVSTDCKRGVRLSESGRFQLRRLMSQSYEAEASVGAAASSPGTTRDRSESGCASSAVQGSRSDDSALGRLSRLRNSNGSPLISAAEYSAGQRLRADFVTGQMTQRTTMVWGGDRAGSKRSVWRDRELSMGERALDARERVRRALAAVGPDFSSALFDVCCLDVGLGEVEARRGWPRRSGKLIITFALRALGRHYGFVKDDHQHAVDSPMGG